jgi:outer membrane biosynthesis protein TonB
MTFTLTINGESAAELLTALQQLNTTPLEKPQSKPAKAPEKPATAPAAAPAENPVPAPAEQPEPVAEQQPAEPENTDAPAITPEQQLTKIRDLARSLIAAGKSKEVQKVINSTGARMVSKIPEDSYTAVWEQLCKIKEELDAAD